MGSILKNNSLLSYAYSEPNQTCKMECFPKISNQRKCRWSKVTKSVTDGKQDSQTEKAN